MGQKNSKIADYGTMIR